jgi:hypothetical protein
VEYLAGAHETLSYISFHPDNIGADGLPALQDGIQLLAPAPSVTGTDSADSEDSLVQQGGLEESETAPSATGTAATG